MDEVTKWKTTEAAGRAFANAMLRNLSGEPPSQQLPLSLVALTTLLAGPKSDQEWTRVSVMLQRLWRLDRKDLTPALRQAATLFTAPPVQPLPPPQPIQKGREQLPAQEWPEAIGDQLLSTEEVAQYFECSADHLARLRMKRQGPDYFKHGQLLRYRKSSIDKWTAENTRLK